MINLVFYNSYQNSYVGFQESRYLIGSKELRTNDEKYSEYIETQKLLTKSGCTCALGNAGDDGKYYFVFRGLNTCDDQNREWYINLGIEADEESFQQFYNVVTNILLDFNGFNKSLEQWFVATPDSSFSYSLKYEGVEDYITSSDKVFAGDIDFYRIDSPYISKYKNMISDMDKITPGTLLLLVPETTQDYFHKQNSFFVNVKKQYVFDPVIFNGLIGHDRSAVAVHWEEKQNNEYTIELARKIVILILAIAGAGFLIKKILSK